MLVLGLILLAAAALYWGYQQKPPPTAFLPERPSISEYVKRLTRLGVTFGSEGDIEVLVFRGDIIWGPLSTDYVPHDSDLWLWRFGQIGRQVPQESRDRLTRALHYTFPENKKQDVSILPEFLRVLEEAVESDRKTP